MTRSFDVRDDDQISAVWARQYRKLAVIRYAACLKSACRAENRRAEHLFMTIQMPPIYQHFRAAGIMRHIP